MKVKFGSTDGQWEYEMDTVPNVGDTVFLPNKEGVEMPYSVEHRAFWPAFPFNYVAITVTKP